MRVGRVALMAATCTACAFLLYLRRRRIINRRLALSTTSQPARPPDTTFVRAKGGLCNKLRVVLSYREAAVVDGGQRLVCVWVINDECPARFAELFEPLDGVTFLDSDDPDLEAKLIALGSPHGTTMKRDMRTHPAIAALGATSEAERWMSEREANMYLQLVPVLAIRRVIAETKGRCDVDYAAVHVRRTDHVALWGVSTPDAEFFAFLDRALPFLDTLQPATKPLSAVYVATDNAASQAAFGSRYGGAARIRTLAPIDAHATALRHTSVSDAVVDLFVCAGARVFKGTRGSSFSDVIWLMRRATGKAHRSDELHTARQLRRRKWRQQTTALSGEARAVRHAAERRRASSRREDGQEADDDAGPDALLAPSAAAPAASAAARPSFGLHVVVAHYKFRSFEPLVDALHEALGVAAVHIYDKSDDGLDPKLYGAAIEPDGRVASGDDAGAAVGAERSCRPVYNVQRVPNVGRESETYLRHLHERYDQHAPYTLYIQDDCHVHIPRHHIASFCEQLLAEMRQGSSGRVLQVVHRGRKLYPARRIDAQDKMHGRLKKACERFGLSMPPSYSTHVCAFFLVSRACVHRQPRELYKQMLNWHANRDSVENRRGASEEELAPWLLEHLWQLIFFTHA